MRTMYDAVYARNIPLGARMVAGYLDGPRSQWAASDWARFPNAVKVAIAVFASDDDGQVLDVENGDARPEDAPPWCERRRAKGCDPTVYCATGTWPIVRQKFTDAGVEPPHYWIADPTGAEHLLPGTVATQWAFASLYDASAVADWWPGIDNGQSIAPIPAAEFLGRPPASAVPAPAGGLIAPALLQQLRIHLPAAVTDLDAVLTTLHDLVGQLPATS